MDRRSRAIDKEVAPGSHTRTRATPGASWARSPPWLCQRRWPWGSSFIESQGVSASAVCKPSSVPIDAEAPSGDGHPSEAAGRPTAHAADPRAGQRASPPAGRPARVAPSYLALLRVEFARFTPQPTRGSATASSLWHWSSSRDGRVLPATLRCGARTFLTPTDAGHPDRCRATIRPAR
jgi:hypothetical protein